MLVWFVNIVIKHGITRFIMALDTSDYDETSQKDVYVTTIRALTKPYQRDAYFKDHARQLIKNNQPENLRNAIRFAH